ncbi:MAG: SpoVG family protein [Elusimicrobiota bacterium]|jgi:DNA-binding cell septation regulator SpoVG|nr:SpoVG family protein [Elusimicrobiota bacterium]
MNKKILFALFFILAFFCRLSNAELKITKVEVEGKKTSLVFNDAFKISGISMQNGNFEMPLYISNGKIYKQFSVINRDFKRYILETLSKNNPSDLKTAVAFKVNKMKPVKKHKNVRAFASVIVENSIEIECRIMNGANGLWIAFPSTKQKGKWIRLLTFNDYALKESIEAQLIKIYLQAISA